MKHRHHTTGPFYDNVSTWMADVFFSQWFVWNGNGPPVEGHQPIHRRISSNKRHQSSMYKESFVIIKGVYTKHGGETPSFYFSSLYIRDIWMTCPRYSFLLTLASSNHFPRLPRWPAAHTVCTTPQASRRIANRAFSVHQHLTSFLYIYCRYTRSARVDEKKCLIISCRLATDQWLGHYNNNKNRL